MPENDDDHLSIRERNRILEFEKVLREAIAEARKESDGAYAIKLVERIVFGGMGVMAIGVLGAILTVLFKGHP